jgi:beta-glucosidase
MCDDNHTIFIRQPELSMVLIHSNRRALTRLRGLMSPAILLLLYGGINGQDVAVATDSDKAATVRLCSDDAVEERVDRLIQEMTLAEKVGQLRQVNAIGGDVTGNPQLLADRKTLDDLIRKGQVGSILNDVDAKSIDRLQKLAVEESRLGVPLIFGRDVIHGFRTVFPIPLGQAASWNPRLAEKAAEIAAREASSVGVRWTFAPMVDIARDPRWGRIAESLGEDPYLASEFSAAMVRGFQGDDLSSPGRIAACAKHFVGYGAGEGGRDYNSAVLSPSLLRNVYLPPFKAAVNSGVATLMTSFNDVNGVPSSANRHLLRDVLRREWGFRGFVVSDWESINEMIEHGYARDAHDAARAAALAGVNVEMVSTTYHDHLADLVESGEIPESVVDGLVAEVMRVKFRLGLFERPYVRHSEGSLLTEEHLDVARELARQSIVLLKNENSLLPLDRSKTKRVAVIGPLANDKRAQLGAWAIDGRPEDCRTPLNAIRETAGDDLEIVHAPGLMGDVDYNKDEFAAAVAAAEKADVVLLFVGESADLSGEARSRAILDLPGAQNELIDAIATAGRPVVLVVQAGRPLTIGRAIEQVDAVLYSFHAGTMAGPAIVDLLWGIESPCGKLPVTFPKSVGQVPLYYNHANTGRPPRPYDFSKDRRVDDHINRDLGYNSNYIDVSPYPLYPFGYGLSYTQFEYGPPELSSLRIRPNEDLHIRVTVTNSGIIAAQEVVQLYVRDLVGSIVRPVRELKAFKRIRLYPGETKKVHFRIGAPQLGFFNSGQQPIIEQGRFDVFVGGSSLGTRRGGFELVP